MARDNFEERSEPNPIKIFLGIGFLIFGAILFFTFLFGSWYILDAGERGVILTMGKINPEVKQPGFHWKVPLFQEIIKYDVKTIKYEAEASGSSKDLQTVNMKIATNYHLVPEQVTTIYQTLGTDYAARVIQPMEQEVVKATSARYTAEELITKREQVREDIINTFKERLVSRGIIVEEVSIVNFEFSAVFNAAVENKVKAEQEALQEFNNLKKVEYEAQQKVTAARGEAESITLRANAIRQNPQLLQLELIQKWDGKLSSVSVGNGIGFNALMDISRFADNSSQKIINQSINQ